MERPLVGAEASGKRFKELTAIQRNLALMFSRRRSRERKRLDM
jgi:hypothetical protein